VPPPLQGRAEEFESLLDNLGPGLEEPAPPRPPVPPAPPVRRPAATPAPPPAAAGAHKPAPPSALDDLLKTAAPRSREKPAEAPPAPPPPATKFRAATARPAGGDALVDLALVAERALGPSRTSPVIDTAKVREKEKEKARKPAAGDALVDLALVAESALGPSRTAPVIDTSKVKEKARKPPARDAAAEREAYGPYRLLERIAVGGMAEVFRAKRTGVEGFEKVLAIKRILAHLSDNKEFVDMFIHEAKMVAGLTHPNIVQMLDLGMLESSYFIAMEYVHGRDLRSIQKRAEEKGVRVPLDLAALIVSKVCAALEYAHRKKDDRGRPLHIVHRDVSPQNILISFEGDVKLTDFGIAKAATKATTTDHGALRGKLLYMSPEQAWGRPIDKRADIFSLGVVFYELATGKKPFLASSEGSILDAVRECRVAPPTSINPRIPDKLASVVMKALDRDPDQRYQDASEMYRDLDRVLHERQVPSAPELSRLMHVLFDERERGELVAEEEPGRSSGDVHVEFDSSGGRKPAGEEPDPSIDKLLKRFGIQSGG
jgi:serine/threonine protein kinase